MKTIIFFFNLIICLIFNQIILGQELDSIKIIPSLPSVQDSIYLATYSDGFSGDCTYFIEIDSIKGNNIYITGKYNSNHKCGISTGVKDTICLGLFSVGTYKVDLSLIDTHGVFQTNVFSINFTVTESSSLYEPNYENKIKVYPNPCSSYTKIYLSSQNSKKSFVQLFNLLGQLKFEKYFQCNNSELTIDMSNSKKGIYFLRIDNGEIFDIKLIKK